MRLSFHSWHRGSQRVFPDGGLDAPGRTLADGEIPEVIRPTVAEATSLALMGDGLAA